jgi:hypothetical protein
MLAFSLLENSTLTGVWSCLIAVLICISLGSCVFWPLVCLFFFWEMSSQVFNTLNIGSLILFLLLSCKTSLYILDINSLSDIWFAKYFAPFWRLLFHSIHCFLYSKT